MIPAFESSFDFDVASEKLRAIALEIVECTVPVECGRVIPADTDVFGDDSDIGDALILIRGGGLQIRDGDKIVMTFEEGEIVGKPPAPFFLSSPDFAVIVDLISLESIKKGSTHQVLKWGELNQFFGSLWLSTTALAVRAVASVLPKTRVFPAGGVIIEQGTAAEEVYTLMEGEADVYVNGVLVGEVRTNEFFGILASVTNSPRTASVIARVPCAVLVVDRQRFKELIQSRPVIVEKLIVELARMVVDLNTKVVSLSERASRKDWV